MAKTYNELYFYIRNALKEKEIESYAQEARILLAAAGQKSKEELMRDMNLYVSDGVEDKVLHMLKRRLWGEPLAYVVGAWEFYGMPFIVNKDVLIPRMDTEVLVSAALEMADKDASKLRILDLCCGSGCIACAVAKNLPRATVVAGDISDKALDVCRENITVSRLSTRVIPVHVDAAKWADTRVGVFDVIISNPPYIATEEIGTLDVSVKDYEPVSALDGGQDGLDFYRSIIKYWTVALRPSGLIMFEVGENQADAVKQLLLDAGYVSVDSRLDTLGVERVVIGKWKNEY